MTTRARTRYFLLILVSTSMLVSPAALADEPTVHLVQDSQGRFRPVLLDSGSIDVLANVNSITAPAVSPDGSRVAFSGAIGDESLGRYAIFVVDSDGSGLDQVTSGSLGEFDPSWSPDGRYIVFSQNTGGSLSRSSCCRVARVDVQTGSVVALSGNNGAQRPEYSPNSSLIVFDTLAGVYTMPASGGLATLRASGGFDASFSPDSESIVYVRRAGTYQLRVQELGGSEGAIYSTGRAVESPKWSGDRIVFIEHLQVGYDSRESVLLRSINYTGSGPVTEHLFSTPTVGVDIVKDNDEIFFYRKSGAFRYYDITPQAGLIPIASGSGYSPNWDIITAVNVDGDHDDEMLFYRESGSFRYYDVTPTGGIVPILTGTDYDEDWSSITAVDLDGDGQDEIFFYRDDGTFAYYNIGSDAELGAPILSGTGYSPDWDSITSIDLDGDGRDEMFFYRKTGAFRYYDVTPGGGLVPIRTGGNYSQNWDSITSIDLDGDGRDEMFFYRRSGSFRYYDVTDDGGLIPILTGTGYSKNWDSITAVDLD